jgi:hypothetical protein
VKKQFSKTNIYFENKCPSPDGNGILLFFSLKNKRYSGQLEIAPKNYPGKY